MTTRYTEIDRQDAIDALSGLIRPGMTVYTCCLDKKGNQHAVYVAEISDGGMPFIVDITHYVAALCGFRKSRDERAIVQYGGGYSKAFNIVYVLGSTLWPKGTKTPHGMRNGKPDYDGGYALKHSSL